MKRMIKYDLHRWANQNKRKPLLMRGARQVGKTHVVRELGKSFKQFVEINFEKRPDFIPVFEKNLDPARIVKTLSAMIEKRIIPGDTLLFFDEIQMCPNAITALRYFYEEMPDLHVIAAGSLLDFAIEQVGIPVGRVQYCYMYPLSFMEYLASLNQKLLFEMVMTHDCKNSLDAALHARLLDLLGQYMLLGGMPAVIAESLSDNNLSTALPLQQTIVETYRDDFPKYAKKLQIKYVDALFHQIPHYIAQSFKFSCIQGDYQKRELDPALNLLIKAGVIHKICHTAGNGVPLGAEKNLEKFKLIFLDIGLNQAMLGQQASSWLVHPLETFVNKGTFTEAYVGQEILSYSTSHLKAELYYWHREKTGSHAEIDYLIEREGNVIPIEVKSGKGSTLKSLHAFLDSKSCADFGVRFSIHPYSLENKLHSYPLYAIAGFLSQYDSELREKLYALISH